MYSDPTNIRNHVIKIRLNDKENALIEALANYTGQQKSSLARELLMKSAEEIFPKSSLVDKT